MLFVIRGVLLTAVLGAAPPPQVRAEALEVKGELRESWGAQLQARFRQSAMRAGIALTDDAARYGLRASVEVDDRDYIITVTLEDTLRGEVVARATDVCEVCGLTEAGDVLARQLSSIPDRLRQLEMAPARLVVASQPPGAKVLIDGRARGITPLSIELPAGQHELRVVAAGFVDDKRSVQALAGQEYRVTVDMLARQETRVHRELARNLGWGALATGGATLGAGAALLGLHGRDYPLGCRGNDVDGDGDCKERFSSARAGIVFTSIAGALLLTGVTLVVRDARQHKRASRAEVGWRTLRWRF